MIRKRFGEFDPLADTSVTLPPLLVQAIFGSLCFCVAFLMREFVDIFTPGAGPFSLIFPAVMLSTLYGKWQSGLLTFGLAFLHAWYYVLPFEQSFAFENPTDRARTVVNGTAALVILFFAETFRSAVRQVSAERDRELKTKELLMLELEHRTKNNFAMVSSLLSMQMRKEPSEEVRQALMTASTRVTSFAAIHESIYTSDKYEAEIPVRNYLAPLIAQLERGLFEDRSIRISLDCPDTWIPRDRALAFGLIVNELVTNAAKHAFPGDRAGVVEISYEDDPGSAWSLTISDDGCGLGNEKSVDLQGGSGLGSALLTSFVTMANGELVTKEATTGTSIVIREIADKNSAIVTGN